MRLIIRLRRKDKENFSVYMAKHIFFLIKNSYKLCRFTKRTIKFKILQKTLDNVPQSDYDNMVKSILEERSMKYVCELCGYVYNPDQGDPDNQIPTGTDFEDIPDEWCCPLCGATKADFEPVASDYDASEF